MIIFAFISVFLSGLAVGIAFHVHRAAEMKRALRAGKYLLAVADCKVEILARDVARRDQTIAKVKALAIRAHVERVLNLGGLVSLPDPARRIGQRLTDRIEMEKRIAGPSNGGPHF